MKFVFFSTKKFYLGFHNALGVDCEGMSGGLALLWKDGVDFEILNFSKHHIHDVVHSSAEGDSRPAKCFLIEVYRHPELMHRQEVLDMIKAIGQQITSPYTIFGNFNKITQLFEELGG